MGDMGNYGYTLFRTQPFFINFLHALFHAYKYRFKHEKEACQINS